MFNEVIFDLETKKLFNEISTNDPADLGVSIVSLYRRGVDEQLNEVEGEMLSFWEDDFPDMWEHFQNADRIIGFNSVRFDAQALKPYTSFPFLKLPHFDILEHVKRNYGKRISLHSLASDTLGQSKTGIGTEAVEFWKKQDRESLDKLQKYCESDVSITRDIYDFGLKNKHLKFKDKWNTPREVAVDFSYSEAQSSNKQDSLF